jgi:6-pyruvoyltetrahydropterin/6-carboxytetrahydropterin synthase
MMYEVTKEVTFDAAHLLYDHAGLCKNLHGHTYKLQVSLQSASRNSQGMVVDFAEVKSLIQKNILDIFDHSFICNQQSEIDMQIAYVLERNKMKIAYFDGNATAESMASLFKELLEESLPFRVAIKLWETPTSFAEVY